MNLPFTNEQLYPDQQYDGYSGPIERLALSMERFTAARLKAKLRRFGIDPDIVFPEDYMCRDNIIHLIRYYYGLYFSMDESPAYCAYGDTPIEKLNRRCLVYLSQYLQAVLAEDESIV